MKEPTPPAFVMTFIARSAAAWSSSSAALYSGALTLMR
jgi:hypothetical protein